MERGAERPIPERDDRLDEALIVPVGARGDEADEPPAPIGTPDASPAPIGTPVEPVADVPQAVVGKLPPWTLVPAASRVEPGRADGLTEDGALPPRPRPSYTAHLLVASLVLLLCVLGAWALAVREQRARERRAFLQLVERSPGEALSSAELPDWLREEAVVQAALERARERVAGDAARDEARRLLERAARAATLDEHLELCALAVRADPTWSTPRARQAGALLRVIRRDLAAALARDPGASASLSAVAPAFAALDAAIARVGPRESFLVGELELQRARMLLAAPGDPEARRLAAIEALGRARRAGATQVTVWRAEALEAALTRDWSAALEHADRALASGVGHDAHLLRGEARLRLGEAAAAARDAAEAGALEPRQVDALALEVEARFLVVRPPGPSVRELALVELDRALAWDPGHPRALAARAYVRLQRDRFGLVRSPAPDRRAARADAELALRLDPGQRLAHAALAELRFAEGDLAGALEAAARAVTCDPDLADLHVVRGRLRARAGDPGALADFDAALRLRPVDARALANRAALLLARGEVAQAQRAADLAVSYDQSLPEAYVQRGLAAYRASRPRRQDAADDLSRALSLDAGLADAWFLRACVLHDVGMHGEALSDLERAEVARATRGAFHTRDLFLARGHCLFKLKRWVEAEAAYAEYARLSSGRTVSPVAARRQARVRDLLAGRIDEATVDVTKE